MNKHRIIEDKGEQSVRYRIVSDSSSNLLASDEFPYASAAMHVMIGGKDWEDRQGTDVDSMTEAVYAEAEKTTTACPSPGQWLEAFGDAQQVLCVTITHQLSGSYDSAVAAKAIYEEEHPDRNVYVIDSLGTGPRMVLLIDHLRDLMESGMSAGDAYREVVSYRDKTDLLFALESVQNFVRNGRINPLFAKVIGVLNMRIVGTATMDGKLKVLSKTRGTLKALQYIVMYMLEQGYCGGRVVIAHHQNPSAAESLCKLLCETFGNVPVEIQPTTALCSYYAETGGLLIGFEKAAKRRAEQEILPDRVRSFVRKRREDLSPIPDAAVVRNN